MFEDKCKEVRDELKTARDEIDGLRELLADMTPREEVNAVRKVCMAQDVALPSSFLTMDNYYVKWSVHTCT